MLDLWCDTHTHTHKDGNLYLKLAFVQVGLARVKILDSIHLRVCTKNWGIPNQWLPFIGPPEVLYMTFESLPHFWWSVHWNMIGK